MAGLREAEFRLDELGVFIGAAARHFDLLFFHDVGRGDQVLLQEVEARLDVLCLELDKVQAPSQGHFVLWVALVVLQREELGSTRRVGSF